MKPLLPLIKSAFVLEFWFGANILIFIEQLGSNQAILRYVEFDSTDNKSVLLETTSFKYYCLNFESNVCLNIGG